MKKKRTCKNFDPNGNYTGKYFRLDEDEIVLTEPEQDVDDL